MGKYLHYYEGLENFQKEYTNVQDGIMSFVCSAGTFVYSGYKVTQQTPAHVWKNGNKELVTPWRNPKVGEWDYDDGTGAFDIDGQSGVEITSVGDVEPAKYHEPWVSYTTYIEPAHTKGLSLYHIDSTPTDTPLVFTDVVLILAHEVDLTVEYCY
jgi:hypothetical protein